MDGRKVTPGLIAVLAGESYEQSGNKSKAVENYREAMKRDPGNRVVNTMAKERLDELAGSSAAPKSR